MLLLAIVFGALLVSIFGVASASRKKSKESTNVEADKENIVKRRRLSLSKKAELAARVAGGELTNVTAAICYNVSEETARRVVKDAVKINQRLETTHFKNTKSMRTGRFNDLEKELHKVILEKRAQKKPLDDSIIREIALEMHSEMGLKEKFNASFGWLRGFKRRFGLRQVNEHGERLDADENAATVFVGEFADEIHNEYYDPEDLYNMDETGCCWRALPSKTLAHAGEKRVDGRKLRKERFTVATCANATGTHRLPLLVIGKSAHPRCFKHVTNLPVVYRHQVNAWINSRLFADWVLNVFKPAVELRQLQSGRSGKVMLLVDNCAAHQLPPDTNLGDKIKIKFLPPNTTSLIQPMDQGCIVKMKRLFKRKFLRRVIHFPGGIKEFYNEYDLKDAVDMLAASWRELTQENLANAWNRLLPTTTHHGTAREHSNEDPDDPAAIHVDTDPDDPAAIDDPMIVEEVHALLEGITAGATTPAEVAEWLREVDDAEEEVFCPEDVLSIEMVDSDTEDEYRGPDKENLRKAFETVMEWARFQPSWVKDSQECIVDWFQNS